MPRPRIMGTLATVAVGLIALYIYFIASSVAYVAATKELAKEVRGANEKLALLESEYLNKKNNISEALAHELGFSEISAVHYVALEKALTLGTNHDQ